MKTTTNRRNPELQALSPYLEQIRKLPPLARDEEHVLALRARKGDASAKEKLVRHNLRFVIAFARKQSRGAVPLDDLIQEGNLGLLRAVEKFDPSAGTRFLTYATWWIRAFIGRYLREVRSSVRPRPGTVAQHDYSLDAPRGDDGDSTFLEQLDDGAPSPEETFLSVETDRDVRYALSKVRKRVGGPGWDIIQSRLARDEPDKLADIGQRWDLSRERIRQIEVKTKKFLRCHLDPAQARDAA